MSNQYDPDKVKSYIERCEAVEREIDSLSGKFKAEVKIKRADIKEIIDDAKVEGIPPAAIKAALKLRDLERKKERIVDGLSDEAHDEFEMMADALGDFAALPLGLAALDASRSEATTKQKKADKAALSQLN